MPMYNLIEYSDNYQDSSATLYQYKRDEPPEANAINDLTTDTSSSFKYKVELLGNPVLDGNIAKRSVKVVVPLKYLSNFFRSLEMPLINCKIKLNLTWNSFGIEHIPQEINKFIRSKELGHAVRNDIKSNIFRIQAYDSIMCGYFCIEFINYMAKGKTLLDYTNLFSTNDFKKNDRIIKRIFKNE